ncbi:hypothetical protein F511_12034 [Dorcoceras hygrometricum]|uniref:Uncharacterized protein n=1 Tax=Dorcoceras hygrometricum TaxID=472368 RepID=A0A2Z7D393_9LAMI|nr:hypothetical protein F511_12034 [Dorcoceras hygrometricum]
MMLKENGLEKWLQLCRLVLHYIAGTPERAWLLFSFVFSMETTMVAIFHPNTIKLINATHQQFEFGIVVLLLSPVIWSIMAFLWSLKYEELSMTSKPRKYGFVAWLVSTSIGLLLSFLSKSSVLLGLSLMVPARLSVGIPSWIRNGYQLWYSGGGSEDRTQNHAIIGKMERIVLFVCMFLFTGSVPQMKMERIGKMVLSCWNRWPMPQMKCWNRWPIPQMKWLEMAPRVLLFPQTSLGDKAAFNRGSIVREFEQENIDRPKPLITNVYSRRPKAQGRN